MIRLLIVDDHPLFREGLQSAIHSFERNADIYEPTSIEGALDVIAAHDDFDLVLLDLSLPGASQTAADCHQRARRASSCSRGATLGIAGDVPKSTPRKELARALQETLAGSVHVPEALLRDGEQVNPGERNILHRLRELTPQQLLVLEMLREGKQNTQIAFDLKLAETAVKAHVSQTLRKLRVFTRTKAVVEVAKVDFKALRKS